MKASFESCRSALLLTFLMTLFAASAAHAGPILRVTMQESLSLYRGSGYLCGALCNDETSPFSSSFSLTVDFLISVEEIEADEFGRTSRFRVVDWNVPFWLAAAAPEASPFRSQDLTYGQGYMSCVYSGAQCESRGNVEMMYSNAVNTVGRQMSIGPPAGPGVDQWYGIVPELFEVWEYYSSPPGTILYHGAARVTNVTPAPEPSTVALVLAGMLAGGAKRRAARKKG